MHVVLFTLCVRMLLGKYRYVYMYANTVHTYNDTRQMQMQGSSRVDTTDYTVQSIQ